MKWLQAKTLEEIKLCGSFKEVRKSVQDILGTTLVLKGRSWKELLESVNKLQSLVENKSTDIILEANAKQNLDTSSLYFQSEAAQIIYALLELDGEKRLKELKISRSFYQDSSKAKKWRNDLARIIHPDKCKHPNAAFATNKLTELFENMVGQ